jgi:hypothetical protein
MRRRNKMTEKNRDFKGIWIPKEIWLSRELSLLEKSILIEFLTWEIEELKAPTGISNIIYLTDFFKTNCEKIKNAISKLGQKGWIGKIITGEIG